MIYAAKNCTHAWWYWRLWRLSSRLCTDWMDGVFAAAMMALLPTDWFRVTWPFILASFVIASSAVYVTLVRGFIVVMGRRPTSHAGCEADEAAAPAAAAEAISNFV